MTIVLVRSSATIIGGFSAEPACCGRAGAVVLNRLVSSVTSLAASAWCRVTTSIV